MAAFVAVAASANAQVGDWGDLVVVSGTLGNTANRLCLGVPASMRPADIGCPTYAPYVTTAGLVGIGTSAPSATLGVKGNIAVGTGGGSPTITFWGANDSDAIIKFSTNAMGTDARWRTFQGTASAPGWSFYNDNNTGIYGDLADGLGISTGGLARLFVDASGNVGIGTTTPNAKLDVYGTISATNLLINGQPVGQSDRIVSGTTDVIATQDRSVTISTAGSQRVVVGENGNVGIGTSTPNVPLTIEANTNQLNLRQIGNTWGLLVGAGTNYTGGAVNSAFLMNVSSGPLALGTGNTERMRIASTGNVGIATITPTATLQVSGSFIVSTSAQNTTPSLYVGTNGNVGVGTSSPGSKLHLADGDLTLKSAAYSDTRRMGFGNPARLNDAAFIEDRGVGNFTGSLVFFGTVANIANEAATEKMRIHSNGNVGIGTTSPNKTLDVSGSANISGTVKIAGTGSESCDGASVGTIRYNAALQVFQMCRP